VTDIYTDDYGDAYSDTYGATGGTGPTTGGGDVIVVEPPRPPVIELPPVATDTGYSRVTEDFYASLPAAHRLEDAAQEMPDGAFPMKRWCASMTEQIGQVDAVIVAADYEPADSRDTQEQAISQLADPDTAPVQWLPWVGQAVGVRVNTLLPAAEQRDQVRGAVSGFSGGTRKALIAAAQSALSGTQHLEVYDHSIANPYDGGGEWDVLLVTDAAETANDQVVLAAIIEKNAKPAGVIIHTRSFASSWDAIEGIRATWAEWDGSTWTQIEQTGITQLP
jgi:hypothetical protein